MIEIYTDGACSHHSTWQGGWAYVLLEHGKLREQGHGRVSDTTNNRMELQAAIEGLTCARKVLAATPEIKVTLCSDSAYVINCLVQKWYLSWQRNGWRTSQRTPVENQMMWEELIALCASFKKIEFKKVAGHSGNHWNEYVDRLAHQ